MWPLVRALVLTLGSSGLNWWAGGGSQWPLQWLQARAGTRVTASSGPVPRPGHCPLSSARVREPRVWRPRSEPRSQRWAADESWLRLRVLSVHVTIHIQCPVTTPSWAALILETTCTNISTNIGKLLVFLQVRTLTIHYGGKTQFRNILSKCKS